MRYLYPSNLLKIVLGDPNAEAWAAVAAMATTFLIGPL